MPATLARPPQRHCRRVGQPASPRGGLLVAGLFSLVDGTPASGPSVRPALPRLLRERSRPASGSNAAALAHGPPRAAASSRGRYGHAPCPSSPHRPGRDPLTDEDTETQGDRSCRGSALSCSRHAVLCSLPRGPSPGWLGVPNGPGPAVCSGQSTLGTSRRAAPSPGAPCPSLCMSGRHGCPCPPGRGRQGSAAGHTAVARALLPSACQGWVGCSAVQTSPLRPGSWAGASAPGR